MMRYYFASALLIATVAFSGFKPQEKQSFEGIIVYRIDAKSKTPNISTENLQKIYGKQMTLSIQGNKYKMSYGGLDLREVFYLGTENQQYALRNDIDTLFTTNCAEDKRQLVSSTTPLETSVIMGHKCHTLVNNLGATQNQYWFDPSIYINPSNFKNHKFGYFNVYYEKAKSLLKISKSLCCAMPFAAYYGTFVEAGSFNGCQKRPFLACLSSLSIQKI